MLTGSKNPEVVKDPIGEVSPYIAETETVPDLVQTQCPESHHQIG